MTREEAIEVLGYMQDHAIADGFYEALDMAISALSADGDIISRADAIEAVEDNSYGMGSRASVKAIKALPSADRPKVEYVCDGRACGADCSECFHTTNIEHAKHFERLGDTYMEKADSPNDLISRQDAIQALCDICNLTEKDMRGDVCKGDTGECDIMNALLKLP